ncbi:hypothetical protein SAMN02745216_00208 [Desulfatibacillum alkenivorans DSM 16219]|uniref:Double Cache domain-containing protein n=1 Tax=Desulfatibacillum alkenivorans DSM 16219 TaxID=1121393 RepID=A0A1M6CCJ3_9BACT|nr:cache domain-containing protein [Desulfatibacillum alkenivorans]SHI58729.1 hypothetical protein SAMN02745216_00208 [Desulfatibacillum alkenivorans DSM 16219]
MKCRGPFLIVMILLVLGFAPASTAQDDEPIQDIAAKTKGIVNAAYDYVSRHSGDMSAVQHALQTNPDFLDREKNLYVFIHCYNIEKKEAVCCGQGSRPELVGKNMWHLRTPSGRMLFFEIARMIEKDGEGWIEYDWLNPYTKTLMSKYSYVRGITLQDGRKAWVGCGFWKNKNKDFQHDDKK